MKTVLVTIHGQESRGENLRELSERLSREQFAEDWIFINIRYSRLLTIVNTLPWVRKMTAKYIAARLDTIDSDYPNDEIIVIAHSNGTRATKIAIIKSDDFTKPYPRFRIDKLILLGCAIKRNFDWGDYPDIEVVNFVSSNDWVIRFARLYGMGRAGLKGFINRPSNLRQEYVRWGHSGFLKQYERVRDVINDMAF